MAFNVKTQAVGVAEARAVPASDRTERAIAALIHRAARYSDQQKFLDWMDLFTDDGIYSAITHENATSSGLYLFKDYGKRALHVRAAFLMGMWQSPRGKTLHLVSNIEVQAHESETAASAVSNFIMTRTPDMEHSRLHACGTYHDRFARVGDAWMFAERRVVVDTNVLPPEFTELL